jgi:hypothetical protein
MIYKFSKTNYNQPILREVEGLSINQTGRIGLTKFFLTEHSIPRGSKAYLYWDGVNKAIAIVFTEKKDNTAYPINFTQQFGAFINAAKFFRLNKLEIKKMAARYSYDVLSSESAGLTSEKGQVFVIDLTRKLTEDKRK